MTAVRTASLSRMRQTERCANLEAELAEMRAQAEAQKRRANALESKLALLASSMQAVAASPEANRLASAEGAPAFASSLPEPSPPLVVEGSVLQQAKHGETSSSPLKAEGQSPRQLIESLRQARLASIGGAAGELKALVSRALAALSRDLYSGAGAMFAELVQNADDAKYSPGSTPRLRISLMQGGGSGGRGGGAAASACGVGLLVEVSESGFTADDVRALCDLGASTKRGSANAATIGRKGLGFKSVFAISDTPYIVSSGYAWKFDVSPAAHGLFGALVPIWVEEAELEEVMPIPPSSLISRRQDGGTTFWLPLREPTHPPPLSLSPSTLLFLRRLRILELTVPPHLGGSRTLRRLEDGMAGVEGGMRESASGESPTDRTQPKPDGSRLERVAISVETASDASGSQQRIEVEEYLVWRERACVLGEETEIALAFHDSRQHPERRHAEDTERECDVHAWLPVMRVGLPFLVQADWALVASRQAIHHDSEWNAALRGALLKALLNAVGAERVLAERVHLWLPRPDQCFEPFWKPLFGVADHLRDVKLLRAEDGGLVAPCDAMLREMPSMYADGKGSAAAGADGGANGADAPHVKTLTERVSPTLVSCAWLQASTGGKRFVAADASSIEELERLGCQRFTVETFLGMLEHWASQEGGAIGPPIGCGEEVLSAEDDGSGTASTPQPSRGAWLREVHGLLHRRMRPEHVRSVRALPLFELRNDVNGGDGGGGAPCSQCPSGHPLSFASPAPTPAGLSYVLTCDVCFGSIEAASPRFSCIECDYDVCHRCGKLAAASSAPRLFWEGEAFDRRLCERALASGAVRLVSARSHSTAEQRALLRALGIGALTHAAVVRCVALQHAIGALPSLDACWRGLDLAREHILAYLADEAAHAELSGTSAAEGAQAALSWLGAALCVPCTDGLCRAPAEACGRWVLGVACPTCCRGGGAEGARGRGARGRHELPPRLLVDRPWPPTAHGGGGDSGGGSGVGSVGGDGGPGGGGRGAAGNAGGTHPSAPRPRGAVPLSRLQTTIRSTASAEWAGSERRALAKGGSGAPRAEFSIRETFESVRAGGNSGGGGGGSGGNGGIGGNGGSSSLSGGPRKMVSVVRSQQCAWQGARCSASLSSGLVAWTAQWKGGELAVGVCCAASNLRQPGSGRYSLAVVVGATGQIEVWHGSLPPSKVIGPPLGVGDTLTIALDADAGVLLLASSSNSTSSSGFLALEAHAPLRQRSSASRRPAGQAYAGASFFDELPREAAEARARREQEQREHEEQLLEDEQMEDGSDSDSDGYSSSSDGNDSIRSEGGEEGEQGEQAPPTSDQREPVTPSGVPTLRATAAAALSALPAAGNGHGDTEPEETAGGPSPDRAAIALPTELHTAELFPFVALRTAAAPAAATATAASTALPASAASVADDFVDDGDDDDAGSPPPMVAEAVIQFCPTIEVPALVSRGFRPLATALAAQRSGGRSAPLVAAPLDVSPASAASERNELQWECFLSLLGARGHLELPGCCSANWWSVVQETDAAQLAGLECAICCDALVALRPDGTPEPGLEAVGTACGHRFHSMCILRWCATDQHPDGSTCPVCRSGLDPESSVQPLGSDAAAHTLASNARELLAQLGGAEEAARTETAGTAKATPALAAASTLASAEAAAARLLARYTREPRTASALGCARVDSACGRVPLHDTLLDGVFPQLRCCSLPLPFLAAPPPARHLQMLAAVGCASAPSLTGDLKALRALAVALSKPGAVTAASAAATRDMLLRAYAAVEASVGGPSGGREEAVREARSYFATHALLWGGEAVGFRRTEDTLSGAPATAAALSRADPISLFPEVSHLLGHVLVLPRATPALCNEAMRALAMARAAEGPKASASARAGVDNVSAARAEQGDGDTQPFQGLAPQHGNGGVSMDLPAASAVVCAAPRRVDPWTILVELDETLRTQPAGPADNELAKSLVDRNGVWLLASRLVPPPPLPTSTLTARGTNEQERGHRLLTDPGSELVIVRVLPSCPLVMAEKEDDPCTDAPIGVAHSSDRPEMIARVFAGVAAFEPPQLLHKLRALRSWLIANRLLVGTAVAVQLGTRRAHGKLTEPPPELPLEALAKDAYAVARGRAAAAAAAAANDATEAFAADHGATATLVVSDPSSLQVRIAPRIDRPCFLTPPLEPTSGGLAAEASPPQLAVVGLPYSVLPAGVLRRQGESGRLAPAQPPERIERSQKLDWSFRRTVTESSSPLLAAAALTPPQCSHEDGSSVAPAPLPAITSTTIVISSEASSPLQALAEALDVLLSSECAASEDATELVYAASEDATELVYASSRSLDTADSLSVGNTRDEADALEETMLTDLMRAMAGTPAGARLQAEVASMEQQQQQQRQQQQQKQQQQKQQAQLAGRNGSSGEGGAMGTGRPSPSQADGPIGQLLQLLSEGLQSHLSQSQSGVEDDVASAAHDRRTEAPAEASSLVEEPPGTSRFPCDANLQVPNPDDHGSEALQPPQLPSELMMDQEEVPSSSGRGQPYVRVSLSIARRAR